MKTDIYSCGKIEEVFTYEQVQEILENVYDYYGIMDHEKFLSSHLSNFSDAPSNEAFEEALQRDIESFIH